MAGEVKYSVLGRLTVRRDDGSEVTPRGALQRRLLASLLLRSGQPVGTGALADVLWPKGLPANHVAALQTHVFRLRRLLPDDAIESGPIGYRLRTAHGDLDLHRFEAGIQEVARLRATDPAAAVEHLEEVLALWRGDPFEDLVDVDDARIETTRLVELRIQADEERAACLLELGRHDSVVADLEALAVRHELRERPQALLMTALHRSGRRAEALAVFERYRRALAEELGIDPSTALRELHDGIVTGELAGPTAPAAGSRPRPAPATAGATPGPPRPNALNEVVRYASSFVGRDEMLDAVAERLEHDRLVTLLGPGGVGKTRLAAETCRRQAGRFGGNLWFCELAAADRSSTTLTVAAALGVDEREGADHRQRIVEVLRVQGGLLVLDNCEHVIEEVAALAEALLQGAPSVRILATSRERLAIDGEALLATGPLPLPDEGDATGPAVDLFLDRARAVVPDWRPDDAERRIVAGMCRRLDGLPLAIELAAARLHTLTLAEVVAGIETRFRLLTGGRRTTARHRSLSAAVGWSYDLLDPPEKAMFDAVSSFQSPFLPRAAAAVADVDVDVAVDLLSSLVERSLVHRVGARYGVLETMRQYGAERLAEHGATAQVRERHARHHQLFVEHLADRLRRGGHPDVLDDLDASLGDLRIAQRWLQAHGSHDDRLRFATGLSHYGYHRMRPEVLGWAEQAARVAAADGHVDLLVGEAWAAASLEAWKRGDLERGSELIEAARRAVEATGGESSYVLETLGHHTIIQGRLDEALMWTETALATDAAAADALFQLEAGGSRVLALGYAGDPRTAAAVEDLLASIDGASPELGAAWAWYTAGEVVAETDPALAAERLRRALALAERCGATFVTVIAGATATSIEARRGDPHRAARDYRWLLALGQRAGVHVLQWTMLRSVAELFVRLGDHATAATLLGAVTSTTAGHQVFGADAERLARVEAEVRAALGDDDAEACLAKGAGMSDDDAVALAQSAFP